MHQNTYNLYSYYMYFGALVGEYYFCMIQFRDMEHIKFILGSLFEA
jgi:hypothetical protein